MRRTSYLRPYLLCLMCVFFLGVLLTLMSRHVPQQLPQAGWRAATTAPAP